jgi:hypothetical protein
MARRMRNMMRRCIDLSVVSLGKSGRIRLVTTFSVPYKNLRIRCLARHTRASARINVHVRVVGLPNR